MYTVCGEIEMIVIDVTRRWSATCISACVCSTTWSHTSLTRPVSRRCSRESLSQFTLTPETPSSWHRSTSARTAMTNGLDKVHQLCFMLNNFNLTSGLVINVARYVTVSELERQCASRVRSRLCRSVTFCCFRVSIAVRRCRRRRVVHFMLSVCPLCYFRIICRMHPWIVTRLVAVHLGSEINWPIKGQGHSSMTYYYQMENWGRGVSWCNLLCLVYSPRSVT